MSRGKRPFILPAFRRRDGTPPIRLYVVRPLAAGLVVCELSARDRRRPRKALARAGLPVQTTARRYTLHTISGLAIATSDEVESLADLAVEIAATVPDLEAGAIDPNPARAAARFGRWVQENKALADPIKARIEALSGIRAP